ncbi:hypothetical protein E3Q11_02730 [Wallemia mellicola]|nr:hypothetical protein E3Q11_02730 [Wallemia mellicola]
MSTRTSFFEARKVAPIYGELAVSGVSYIHALPIDLLEDGHYSIASRQCETLLQNKPDWELVRALLAFSYCRSARTDDARKIAYNLADIKPKNSDTMAALNLTLTDLRAYDKLAEMYKLLWEQNGSINDNNGRLTAMAYIKAQNWKGMQSVSMRLSKVSQNANSVKFTWWTIAGLFMQAQTAKNEQEKSLAFTLALRLADSVQCQSDEEVHLLVRLFWSSGNPRKASDLLVEHDKEISNSLALEELQWDVWKELDEVSLIKNKAKSLLEGGSGNYAHHTAYLSTVKDNREEAVALFEHLAQQNPKERGHIIALMEIERKFSKNDNLVSLLERYWHLFKNKPVCFDDIITFMKYLHHEKYNISSLNEVFIKDFNNKDESLDTRLNAAKLVRCLSLNIALEKEIQNADLYAQLHKEYLVAGEGVPKTDLHPADDWAVLSGISYISAYSKSRDLSYLTKASENMEFALSKSERSYKLKLLLISIYRITGNLNMFDLIRKMRIQSVQQDTLTHHGCGELSTFAMSSLDVVGVLPNTNSSFSGVWGQAERECSEMLSRLFDYGTWSHLEDFSDFAGMLKYSLHKWILWFEDVRIKLGESPKIEGSQLEDWLSSLDKLDALSDNLVDNRDWSLLPSWAPFEESETREQLHILTYQEGNWLKKYSEIYRRIFSVVLNKPNECTNDGLEELTSAEKILEEISHLIIKYNKQGSDAEKAPVGAEVLDKFGDFSKLLTEAALPCDKLHAAKVSIETWSLIRIGIAPPSKKKKTKSPSYGLYQGIVEQLQEMVKDWKTDDIDNLWSRLHSLVDTKIDYKNS